jgi:subtilisin family serine protease
MPITRLIRPLTSAVLAVAAVLLISPGASAQSNGRGDKLDKFLRYRSKHLSGRSRVIVEFNGDTDVRVFGKRGAAGRKLGRNSQVAEVDNAELANLASNPRVKRVMHDRPTFATLERTGLSTGAALVRQQMGYTGKGIGVAVIDSGISNAHDDLYRTSAWSFSTTNGRVAHFKDFTVDNPNVWSPNGAYDDYGHGTHVAGIIAGTGYDSSGKHKGIAPGARLVGLKVMDQLGRGYISDVIAAIDYAISVKTTYNVRVINLSVASGVYDSYWTDPLTLAAKRAVDAGIVVVASAGNHGQNELGQKQSGGITSPGNAPWVLTVGASSEEASAARSNDTIAKFSSQGPTWIDFSAKPDLVAPGVGIESLSDAHSTLSDSLPSMLLSGTLLNLGYKPYLSLSGTSMAAPVVSGTVALMLEANPKLTPNAVKAILQYTAQVRSNTSALVQGAGMLNARGAVRLAKFFSAPANGVGSLGDSIQGEWVPWAKHIIWGNYRLTGGIILPGSNAWSTSVRWGALKTTDGSRVVWGARSDDNIVWSTVADNIVWSTMADDNIVWSTVGDDNIVWSTGGDDNIVWSTAADDNIVWSTGDSDNIVWSTAGDDNIVWSTGGEDNIVWSTGTLQNVVWGGDCGGRNCQKVVWGEQLNGVVMGTAATDDNIVWSTAADDNIVWSTAGPDRDNIVWSTAADDNIVWSTSRGDDNIVWSTGTDDAEVVWADTGEALIVPVE